LPVLRKHYLRYEEFAGLEMKDALYGYAEQVEPFKAERLGSMFCLGDGKGDFAIKDLPAELQLAPKFSFQRVHSAAGENMFISGGNFFDVIPYEGRYDAQPLALFEVKKTGEVRKIHQANLSTLKEQVRDLKWIRTAKGPALAVASNNSGLLFYRIKK
jgi:hypothetical protein